MKEAFPRNINEITGLSRKDYFLATLTPWLFEETRKALGGAEKLNQNTQDIVAAQLFEALEFVDMLLQFSDLDENTRKENLAAIFARQQKPKETKPAEVPKPKDVKKPSEF